ncbi:hypothetical protein ACFLT9_00405 [Acidobacteriota bacterium]
MKISTKQILILLLAFGLVISFACTKAEEPTEESGEQSAETPQEITQDELKAAVPSLSDLHEVIYPLWHTAYPEKNYEMIKELMPQVDELTAKMDEASLPGILRDKQAAWDEGKTSLKDSLKALHEAADTGDEEGMLKQTEAFHSAYERLVRTIRPLVAELDAFHQELYKVFHYHAPEYNLEKLREGAAAMAEKVVPLKGVELPSRLADRQEGFNSAVLNLEAAVNELVELVQGEDKEAILKAVDKVHTAYQGAEQIFN